MYASASRSDAEYTALPGITRLVFLVHQLTAETKFLRLYQLRNRLYDRLRRDIEVSQNRRMHDRLLDIIEHALTFQSPTPLDVLPMEWFFHARMHAKSETNFK